MLYKKTILRYSVDNFSPRPLPSYGWYAHLGAFCLWRKHQWQKRISKALPNSFPYWHHVAFYAYEIAKAYGPLSYQNPNLFSNTTKHSEILAKAEQQRLSRLPHEAYLKHFDDCGECVPIWAYVDLLTIADISFLYAISIPSLKKSIADAFGFHPTKGSDLLRRFMHSMTIIRNLCAHGSRLYNRIFQQKPRLSKAELSLLRKNANGTLDNAHLYGFLFIMKRMLRASDFNEFKKKLIALSDRFSFVNMRYYGFRSDWRQRL